MIKRLLLNPDVWAIVLLVAFLIFFSIGLSLIYPPLVYIFWGIVFFVAAMLVL